MVTTRTNRQIQQTTATATTGVVEVRTFDELVVSIGRSTVESPIVVRITAPIVVRSTIVIGQSSNGVTIMGNGQASKLIAGPGVTTCFHVKADYVTFERLFLSGFTYSFMFGSRAAGQYAYTSQFLSCTHSGAPSSKMFQLENIAGMTALPLQCLLLGCTSLSPTDLPFQDSQITSNNFFSMTVTPQTASTGASRNTINGNRVAPGFTITGAANSASNAYVGNYGKVDTSASGGSNKVGGNIGTQTLHGTDNSPSF